MRVINARGESLVEYVFLAAGESAQLGQVLRPWQLICGSIVEPTSNRLVQECCVWHDIEAIQRKGDATTTDLRHGSPTAIARRRTLGAYPRVQRHGRLCARDSMLMCVDCFMQRERAGRARTMQTTIINCGSVNTDAAPGEWSDKKSQQWRFEEQSNNESAGSLINQRLESLLINTGNLLSLPSQGTREHELWCTSRVSDGQVPQHTHNTT